MIQKIKKPVSILLTVLMVFSVFAVVPFAASAAELTGWVNVRNLSVGDIIGGDVQNLSNYNYTLTLEANRYGDYYGKKTEATVTSSFNFSKAQGSEPVSIYDMNGYNRYYPYDENGNRCEAFIVTAVDHSASTFSLAGYLEPDNPVLLNSSVKYRYCDGTAFHTGNTPAASTYKVDTGNRIWTNNSWYVVTENVTFEKRIKIKGTVNLVLCDGATLTAKQGFSVNNTRYDPRGAGALNIYAQNGGTGALYAGTANGTSTTMNDEPQRAAIGGDDNNTNGDITIHGGNIYAISNIGTAGIGGGRSSEGGNVTIYGGNVTAGNQNSYGSGIGGGYHADAGNINILGGTVTAFATGEAYDAAFGTTTTDRTVNLTIPEGATMVAGNNADSAVATTVDEYKANRKIYARVEAGELPNYYTVDWKNDDGSVLKTKEFAASAIPVYDGETPTKPEDETNTYTFAGWKNGETTYAPDAALPAVTGDITYTATFTSAPFVASVTSNGTTTKYANFSDALNAWTDGSTLTLLSNVENGSRIYFDSGVKTLDLNGYGIKNTSANYEASNSVIYIRGSGTQLTLQDSRPNETTHYFTAPAGNAGLATDISDIDSGDQQSFHGGYLTGGNCFSGGGIRVDNGANLIMTGGTIIGNRGQYGGGIDVEKSGSAGGSATISGGAIMYNYGTNYNGAIHTNGANYVSVSNCKITNNYAQNGAGAVYKSSVSDGFSGNMVVKDNKTGNNECNIVLGDNERISLSSALGDDAYIGITMSNPGVFTNSTNTDLNNPNNFFCDNKNYIAVKNASGQLEFRVKRTVTWKNDDGTVIDTTTVAEGETPTHADPTKPEDETNTYTFAGWKNGETTYAPDAALPAVTSDVTYTAVFTATPYVASVTSNGTTTKYTDFGTAVSNWTDGSTLKLLANVERNSTINVTGTQTLDLNGYGIKMTAEKTTLFYVTGDLTLNDSDTTKIHKFDPPSGTAGLATLNEESGSLEIHGGYITGFNGDKQYVIHIPQNARFTMNGGNLIGNEGTASGSNCSVVIVAQGDVTINGGAIIYNKSGYWGAAINCINVTINGGTIAHNYSKENCGAIYCHYLTMTGGSVTDNYANKTGLVGGITVERHAELSGNPIIKNNSDPNGAANFTVYDYTKCSAITSALGENACIGITGSVGVFTDSTNTSFNDPTKFFSDNSNYVVGKNAAGQLLLGVPRTVTWKDDEGNTIDTTTVANGGVPTHDAPEKAGCNFTGWKNGDTTYPADSTLPEVTGNTTYTATFEPKKLIAGHTLTLDGNIGINFYIDPSAAGLEPGQNGTLKVDFAWANSDPLVNVAAQSKTVEVNSSNYTQVGDLIKVTCKVCAAEMSCDVKATVALNNTTETEDYCVRDYCDVVLDSESDFAQDYITTNGEAKYAQLCDLVTKMLDYGAKAQTVFNINTEDLANSALDYEMEDVTAAMIEEAVFAANGSNTTTDFNAVASALGAKWYTTSLIYLTENTLRVYFVKNTSAFNPSDYQGNKANYYYYVEKSNIAPADLDKHQTFTVGNQTFKYSALDFAKLMITGNAEPSSKELAKALYWYNQAANVFFGGGEPVIPVEPTDPTSPTDSTDPTSPTDSTDPTSPDNPVHPTEPFYPTEPDPIEP